MTATSTTDNQNRRNTSLEDKGEIRQEVSFEIDEDNRSSNAWPSEDTQVGPSQQPPAKRQRMSDDERQVAEKRVVELKREIIEVDNRVSAQRAQLQAVKAAGREQMATRWEWLLNDALAAGAGATDVLMANIFGNAIDNGVDDDEEWLTA